MTVQGDFKLDACTVAIPWWGKVAASVSECAVARARIVVTRSQRLGDERRNHSTTTALALVNSSKHRRQPLCPRRLRAVFDRALESVRLNMGWLYGMDRIQSRVGCEVDSSAVFIANTSDM